MSAENYHPAYHVSHYALPAASVEAVYPLSVVSDGPGINITVVSYLQRLCGAVTSCPTEQPGLETLGRILRQQLNKLANGAGGKFA